jgi:cytochrome c oxidase cbb3-type subunit III
MADFTSDFWSIYIAVLTFLGIAGCTVLLWVQSKAKIVEGDGEEAKTTGHSWDEGLTELNNPMPRWWMWLFYITIVFGLVYLVLYPGMGAYPGTLGWKSLGAYEAELNKADAEYGPIFAAYQQTDLKQVGADPQARAVGERLFLTYCSQCHGSDARGSKGYPNLADKDWLWGGEPETIKTSILKGRAGVMPPMAAMVGSDRDIDNVAHYVLSLSGATADPIKAVFGKTKFAVCAGCHGVDGRGNQALGAPNLTDRIWLYGGGAETIKESIRRGRSNTMPPFEEFLGEAKVHVLAAYVWSLSNSKPEE